MAAEPFDSYKQAGFNIAEYSSGRVRTTCPKCASERTNKTQKCVSINATLKNWKCHHCGWVGFIATDKPLKRFKIDYAPPVPKARIFSEEGVPQEIAPGDISGLPAFVVKHFAERGISEDYLAEYQVGYKAKHYFAEAQKEMPAICFTYHEDGELVQVKYRSRFEGRKIFATEKKDNGKYVPWNIDNITTKYNYLIWTEGEYDALSCIVAYHSNTISVPLGAPQPADSSVDGKLPFWSEYVDLFLQIDKHIIMVDNDEPGRKLSDELVRRLGTERCYLPAYPPGCKDPNDILVKYGPDALEATILQAQPIPVEGLFTVESVRDRVIDLYSQERHKGLTTGWGVIDEHFTLHKREMTFVGGVPQSGKSTYLDALMVQVAVLHGWKFLVFSPEAAGIEAHIAGLCSAYVGKAFYPFWGERKRMSKFELDKAMEFLNEHFVFVQLDEESPTLEKIFAKFRAEITRNGGDCIVIDPWNEVAHRDSENQAGYLNEQLGKCRKFIETMDVHGFIVAHPRVIEAVQADEGSVFKIPGAYQFSGGAGFFNKGANIIMVHRPDPVSTDSTRVQLHFQKIKRITTGKPGAVELYFEPHTGRYKEFLDQEID